MMTQTASSNSDVKCLVKIDCQRPRAKLTAVDLDRAEHRRAQKVANDLSKKMAEISAQLKDALEKQV